MGNKDLQCIFTLTLVATRVNRGARQSVIVQVIINQISLFLPVDEDDCASRRAVHQQIAEAAQLVHLGAVHNLGVSTDAIR